MLQKFQQETILEGCNDVFLLLINQQCAKSHYILCYVPRTKHCAKTSNYCTESYLLTSAMSSCTVSDVTIINTA